MSDRLERLCVEKGLKMTEQRRIIARVLSESTDHPDVELLYQRATALDPRISIATVYRTVKLFEEASILDRHDFGDGRARYEEAPGGRPKAGLPAGRSPARTLWRTHERGRRQGRRRLMSGSVDFVTRDRSHRRRSVSHGPD
jgi:hypothetical protein